MPSDHPPGRRRTLFLSHIYPSMRGSGTQIRAASLLRMMAAREDVYLLLINHPGRLQGPEDPELPSLCRNITHLQILTPDNHLLGPVESSPLLALPRLDRIDCLPGEVPSTLKSHYESHGLNSLFVFRIETFFLMNGALDLFPSRLLDLDELTFRRNSLIENLKSRAADTPPDPAHLRSHHVLKVLEKNIIPRFQKVFVSSKVEVLETLRLVPGADVHLLPNIFPLHPPGPAGQAPADPPRKILFVGNLSYYPNEDAVLYFCHEILPRIQQASPEPVVFRIFGMGCPESLHQVHGLPGVELVGYVENLGPHYARASLVAVPLRAGTGTRLKILEAFSHQRPVVSTTIGAEGLEVTHGANILLADDAEDFAAACLRLLSTSHLALQIADGGRTLLTKSYSFDRLLERYDATMNGPVRTGN